MRAYQGVQTWQNLEAFFVGKNMKLKQSYETEVYLSNAGYFCIKQEDAVHPECLVLLSPGQMEAIVKEWNRIKEDQALAWNADEDGE